MGWYVAGREKFLGTNFMYRKKQGEDKALTLPNNSLHPVNTKAVTKHLHCAPINRTLHFPVWRSPNAAELTVEVGMLVEETTQGKQKQVVLFWPEVRFVPD